jgi:hypothetical protein
MATPEGSKPGLLASIREWVGILASLVVLVAAGLAIYHLKTKQIEVISTGDPAVRKVIQYLRGLIMMAGPNSPVRIVGGSMKIRTTISTWTPCTGSSYTNPTCVLSSSTSAGSIYLDLVDPANYAPTSLPSLDGTWTIKVWARDTNGKPKKANGITVCPTTDGSSCNTSSGATITGILVRVTDNSAASLIQDAIDENSGGSASASQPITQYRYDDLKHNEHDYLDHIGTIDVVQQTNASPYTYTCHNGLCEIFIGG